jgi:hypothetical protein
MRVNINKDEHYYVHWRYNFKKKARLNKNLEVIFDYIPKSTECFIRNKNKELVSTGFSKVYKIDLPKYNKAEGRQRSFDKALKIFENSDKLPYFYQEYCEQIREIVELNYGKS